MSRENRAEIVGRIRRASETMNMLEKLDQNACSPDFEARIAGVMVEEAKSVLLAIQDFLAHEKLG